MLPKKMPWRGGGVYFILGDKTKLVKIGWSINVSNRLHALIHHSPDVLTILAVIRSQDVQEKLFINGKEISKECTLHIKFSEYRQHGEWFSFKGELKKFIAKHIFEHPFYKGEAAVEYRNKINKIFGFRGEACKR